MAANTNIEWTDHSMNWWMGCTKVSAGCAHCYAERETRRFGKDLWGKGKPRQRTAPGNWKEPYKWNEAAADAGRIDSVFTLSMGDILDPEVPQEWLTDAWRVMCDCQNLRWLVLTKRPEEIDRLRSAITAGGGAPLHLLLGTSIEDRFAAHQRWPALVELKRWVYKAAEKKCGTFFSCEPLLKEPALSDLWDDLFARDDYSAPDWVIIGGESGPKARPCMVADVRSVMADAKEMGAKVFVKQLGRWPVVEENGGLAAVETTLRLNDKKGGDMAEWPEDLRVREFPWATAPAVAA